jgi:hypothetical protein
VSSASPNRGYGRFAPAVNAARYSPTSEAGRFVGHKSPRAESDRREAVRFAPTTEGGTFGPHPGSGLFAPTGRESIDSLLQGSGFAAALERPDGKRLVLGDEDHPASGLKSLSIVTEVNNLSDFQITTPASPKAYDFRFADAVIAYNGDRLFHGEVWPAQGDSGSQEVALGGFGPLKRLTEGHVEFRPADAVPDSMTGTAGPVAGDDAIDAFWQRVSNFTDGHVRGTVLAPPAGEIPHLPPEKTYSGTYLGVLKDIHADAGLIFTLDHAETPPFCFSFVPSTQAADLEWQAKDYSPTVDPAGYANRIVVRGAQKPNDDGRYRAVVMASEREIEAVAFGRVITHRPPPDDSLGSEAACREHAGVLLDNARSEFDVTGSVQTTPLRATAGYVYRVPEFEKAAPDIFGAVELPLQSVDYSYGPGEASVSLAFETADGVLAEIRERVGAGPAAHGDGTAMVGDADGDGRISSTYPHTYPGPRSR